MESPVLNAEEKKKFDDIRYGRAGKIEVMRSLQKTCCYYWLSENCKGSIFTGTNNFVSNTITSSRLNEYYGFVQNEVDRILEDAEIKGKGDIMKKWFEDSSKKWNRTEFIKSIAW